MEDLKTLWSKWDSVHSDADQLKRQKSACDAKLTPISVDEACGEAIFQGSKSQYRSTLVSCECVDFIRRKMPCKHMYRLAIALDLIEAVAPLKTGDAKKLRKDEYAGDTEWKEIVQKIEKLSDDSQRLFHRLISSHADGKRFVNEKLQLRIELSNELIDNNIFVIDRTARVNYYGHINDDFLYGRAKVAKYFRRKFYGCYEEHMDPNTLEFVRTEKPYPNDNISDYLVERGFISRSEIE